MSNDYLIDDTINIALKNINNYIDELNKLGNIELSNKLKEIYQETKDKNKVVLFNLVYRDEVGNINRICNEKFIYDYFKEGRKYFRRRIEIDGEKQEIYPNEIVNEDTARNDLQNMGKYRPVLYVK